MKRIKKLVHIAHWVDDEEGMTTAEYAVGTVAACGFGGLLLNLLTSDSVLKLLADVIRHAFDLVF